MNIYIRWMIRRDMAEVLAIEQDGFWNPWDEEDFIRCLRQNSIGMVAEHDERVVGFMIYELHKDRLHVSNFAVATAYRRRGVGIAMIANLREKLLVQHRTRITLKVRETNLPAQQFFQSQGFRAVRVIRGAFDDTDEDAYVMIYRIRARSAHPRSLGSLA
jgi:ribosomal-protein-alanine N-acetyltransferase